MQLYINALDININGLVSTFAADTKIAGVTDCEEGCQSVQRDIGQLQNGQRNG